MYELITFCGTCSQKWICEFERLQSHILQDSLVLVWLWMSFMKLASCLWNLMIYCSFTYFIYASMANLIVPYPCTDVHVSNMCNCTWLKVFCIVSFQILQREDCYHHEDAVIYPLTWLWYYWLFKEMMSQVFCFQFGRFMKKSKLSCSIRKV